MATKKTTRPVTIKGMPDDLRDELMANWVKGAGQPTTMESYLPVVVVRSAPAHKTAHTALLVALRPDGQQAFGLVDDGAGMVGVRMVDLSELGFPNHLTSVERNRDKLFVYAAMWLARDGLPFINVMDAAKAATAHG